MSSTNQSLKSFIKSKNTNEVYELKSKFIDLIESRFKDFPLKILPVDLMPLDEDLVERGVTIEKITIALDNCLADKKFVDINKFLKEMSYFYYNRKEDDFVEKLLLKLKRHNEPNAEMLTLEEMRYMVNLPPQPMQTPKPLEPFELQRWLNERERLLPMYECREQILDMKEKLRLKKLKEGTR
jgi:hypothetical protein